MNNPDSTNKHFELAVGLSTEALKALLVVNGGAAAALIALTDKSGSKHDYSQAIIMFGIGALLTVASFIFGYLSQLAYANCRFASDLSNEPERKRQHCLHLAWNHVAITMCILALIVGGIGMFTALAEARS